MADCKTCGNDVAPALAAIACTNPDCPHTPDEQNTEPLFSREWCWRCQRYSPLSFAVPNEVWAKVVPSRWREAPICLNCFAHMADERLVYWTQGLKIFPRALAQRLVCETPDAPIQHLTAEESAAMGQALENSTTVIDEGQDPPAADGLLITDAMLTAARHASVLFIDGTRGHTCEFSSDPEEHIHQYDYWQEILAEELTRQGFQICAPDEVPVKRDAITGAIDACETLIIQQERRLKETQWTESTKRGIREDIERRKKTSKGLSKLLGGK